MNALLHAINRRKGTIILISSIGLSSVAVYYYPEEVKSVAYNALNQVGLVSRYDEVRNRVGQNIDSVRNRMNAQVDAFTGSLPSFMRQQQHGEKSGIKNKTVISNEKGFESPPASSDLFSQALTSNERLVESPAEPTKNQAINGPLKEDKLSTQPSMSIPSQMAKVEIGKGSVINEAKKSSNFMSTETDQLNVLNKRRDFKTLLFDSLGQAQDAKESVFRAANCTRYYGSTPASSEQTAQESIQTANELADLKGAAMKAIGTLRKVIEKGRSDSELRHDPLLVNAEETAKKYQQELDDLDSLLLEYKKGKIRPELLSSPPKVSEQEREQLEASLGLKKTKPLSDTADLEKEIKTLEKRLMVSKQETETQEEKRDADARLATVVQGLESQRLREKHEIEYQNRLLDERKVWEDEFQRYVEFRESEFAKKIESIIRTQRKLFEIESDQRIEEAVGAVHRKYAQDLEKAYARVDGIQTALGTRIVQDFENRRTKLYWSACQNLLEAIVYGNQSGDSVEKRKRPLKEVQFLHNLNTNDFVRKLIANFSDQSVQIGVCTEADLKKRFTKAYSIARRTAKIDEDGGSYLAYFLSYIQHLFTLDLPRVYSPDEEINLNSIDPYDILSRLRYFVSEGDFEMALKLANLLRGDPARIFNDWMRDTRQHLEARFLADLIITNASGTSIRTS